MMNTTVERDNRNGEIGPTPFRAGRFYSIGNYWYFSVRGTSDQGPYISRKSAELALEEFLQNVNGD